MLQKRASDTPELELRAAVRYLMLVVGIRLGSSVTMVVLLTVEPSLHLFKEISINSDQQWICFFFPVHLKVFDIGFLV